MTTKQKRKDVLIRALKTLWQASASYVIVNIGVIADALSTDLTAGGYETIKQVGITVLVGAIAAGLSAVYNGFIKGIIDTKADVEEQFEEIVEDVDTEQEQEQETEDIEGDDEIEGVVDDGWANEANDSEIGF